METTTTSAESIIECDENMTVDDAIAVVRMLARRGDWRSSPALGHAMAAAQSRLRQHLQDKRDGDVPSPPVDDPADAQEGVKKALLLRTILEGIQKAYHGPIYRGPRGGKYKDADRKVPLTRKDMEEGRGRNVLGKDAHYQAGANFDAGDAGSYHIDKRDGDGVTFHMKDSAGTASSSITMPVSQFRQIIKLTNQQAIVRHVEVGLKKRQATLERAKKLGGKAAIVRSERELQRWQAAHKEYLPDDAGASDFAKQAAAQKQKRDAVEKNPTIAGHLELRGIDPNHPYLKANKARAQKLWDEWGLVLIPPTDAGDGSDNSDNSRLAFDAMMRDLNELGAIVDYSQTANASKARGLAISVEPVVEVDKPSEGFRSGEAGGLFRIAEDHIKVALINAEKGQHTFLHELAHAHDYDPKSGSFRSSGSLKDAVDALGMPHAAIHGGDSHGAAYYKRPTERLARAVEQVLAMLGRHRDAVVETPIPDNLIAGVDRGYWGNVDSKFTASSGYWPPNYVLENADKFAQVARSVGFPIDPKAVEELMAGGAKGYVAGKEVSKKERQARDLERSVKRQVAEFDRMTESLQDAIAQKHTGHANAKRALEYHRQGKYKDAARAMELADSEHSTAHYATADHSDGRVSHWVTASYRLADINTEAAAHKRVKAKLRKSKKG